MIRFILWRLALALFLFLFTSESAASLPPLSGYVSRHVGPCHAYVQKHNLGIIEELEPVCKQRYRQINTRLGLSRDDDVDPLQVRVVNSPKEMASVAPKGAGPPSWSIAVAYPDRNLIILSLNHRSGHPVENLNTIFEHELSHLALRKLLGGAAVPRWFSEGLAIHQSERSSFSRYWTLWIAANSDNLLSLEEIERYPKHTGRIDLAYAEAADFVGFLLRKGGWLAIRTVIRKVANGAPFDEAFEYAYRDSVRAMEHTWLRGLLRRPQWLALVTGTGALWGFIVALFLVAYAMVRHREKKRLDKMEEEEAQLDRLMAAGDMPGGKNDSQTKLSKPEDQSNLRTDDIYTLH
ncbi:MAG: hypothetical protein GY762_04435 [Proteobacteria bacterium]|nr:hypothetical protein [Pseudomonadota bacterium]